LVLSISSFREKVVAQSRHPAKLDPFSAARIDVAQHLGKARKRASLAKTFNARV
jgi:hypothetical protein